MATLSPTWKNKEALCHQLKKHPVLAKAYQLTCLPLPLQLPLSLINTVLAEAFTHQAQKDLTVWGTAVDMGHRVNTVRTMQQKATHAHIFKKAKKDNDCDKVTLLWF